VRTVFVVSEFQKILENVKKFVLNLGGWRFIRLPKAVEGGYFPLQSLLYLSRNEKLSRNNRRLLYSDGRNCPEVYLVLLKDGTIFERKLFSPSP